MRAVAFCFLVVSAVFAAWALSLMVFSLEPETPGMPAAQHQRPFESDKELRRLTNPVAPRFATEMAVK